MNTPAFSMSGIVSLNDTQVEYLTMLGLEVPSMMTKEQLQALVAQADTVQTSMDNPMVAKMVRQTLDELKASFGLV